MTLQANCPGCGDSRPVRELRSGYAVARHELWVSGAEQTFCEGGRVSSADVLNHIYATVEDAKREVREAEAKFDAEKPSCPLLTPANMAERYTLACLRMARSTGASAEYLVKILKARLHAFGEERYGANNVAIRVGKSRRLFDVEIVCNFPGCESDVRTIARGVTVLDAIEMLALHIGAIT